MVIAAPKRQIKMLSSITIQASLNLLAGKYVSDGKEMRLRSNTYWGMLESLSYERSQAINLGRDMLSCDAPYGRFFGITLLGEICNPVEVGEGLEADMIADWITDAIDGETSVSCLCAMAQTLGGMYRPRAERGLMELSRSENDDVRWNAVTCFGSITVNRNSARVTKRLIELSKDRVASIRDWATMYLGDVEKANEVVREALVARLTDRHLGTRTEAIYALANMHDPRALPALKKCLAGSRANQKDIESAGVYGLVELYQYLRGWDGYGEVYKWACKRCSPDKSVRAAAEDEWYDKEFWQEKLAEATTQADRRSGHDA